MECKIHPRVNYLRVPEIIKSQREVRLLSTSITTITTVILTIPKQKVGVATNQRDFQVPYRTFSTCFVSDVSGQHPWNKLRDILSYQRGRGGIKLSNKNRGVV